MFLSFRLYAYAQVCVSLPKFACPCSLVLFYNLTLKNTERNNDNWHLLTDKLVSTWVSLKKITSSSVYPNSLGADKEDLIFLTINLFIINKLWISCVHSHMYIIEDPYTPKKLQAPTVIFLDINRHCNPIASVDSIAITKSVLKTIIQLRFSQNEISDF